MCFSLCCCLWNFPVPQWIPPPLQAMLLPTSNAGCRSRCNCWHGPRSNIYALEIITPRPKWCGKPNLNLRVSSLWISIWRHICMTSVLLNIFRTQDPLCLILYNAQTHATPSKNIKLLPIQLFHNLNGGVTLELSV